MKPVALVLTFLSCLMVPIRAGFAQSGIITTYVGPALPSDGAAANTQVVDSPMAVIGDGSGGFYFTSDGQNRVYKVTASGVISAVAGSGARGFGGDGGSALTAQLNSPHGIALDATGNLYIADYSNNRVRRITAGGIITTIAGNGTVGGGGDGGPAISAQLNLPRGIAVDSTGNVFIADSGNNRVRKVTPAGIISTIAGNGISSFSGDGGPATAAAIWVPTDIAVDTSGNLFIADGGNHRVRKVSSGVISTVAGSATPGFGGDGGPATAAQLNSPYNIDVDAAGNLFIADRGNARIRRVAGGVINTIAGLGNPGFSFSGDGGPATSALFDQPEGIAVDTIGNIFVADTGNNRVRLFTLGGFINTVAGRSTSGFSGDVGAANAAMLNGPQGVAVDAAGNVFITDRFNNRIRKVTQGGVISTVAGNGSVAFSGDNGPALNAGMTAPSGIAVDAAGNIFIADEVDNRIRKVTTGGVISTVAGNGNAGYGGDGGLATSAALLQPTGVALDTAGNIFIADRSNNRVRKVTPNGIISTVAGTGAAGFGGDDLPAASTLLSLPTGVAVDAAGNLFIADYGNRRVRKVNTNGIISTIAGDGSFSIGVDGGPAVSVGLTSPTGVSVDALGNVYFADVGLVRKITPAGLISTIVGDRNPGFRGDGGPSIAAQINHAQGVAVDTSGNLYIADYGNHRIRKVARRTQRDFNNDGNADVLWRNNAGDVSAWLLNGYTVTNNSFISNIQGGWSIAGTGDFDGDGKADILWRNTSGDAAIWRMDGATVSSFATVGNLPTSWTIAGIADFNADGKADILWRNTTGDVAAWLMNGYIVTNNNTFIANKPASWAIAGTADFDGDGKGDVLWRDVSGDVAIWIMNGTTVSSNTTLANIWPGWSIAGVADFDANGRADILWRDVSGNVAIWLMNGTTVASWSLIADIWKGWSIVGTGDFNGNGEADILWRDESGGVAIWMMDGATVSSFGTMGNVSDRMPQ